MKEISTDLFDELDSLPTPKPRKSKTIERDHRSWFYVVDTVNGDCSNPDCKDPRDKANGVTMVWHHPSGESVCRYCFLGGWLVDD